MSVFDWGSGFALVATQLLPGVVAVVLALSAAVAARSKVMSALIGASGLAAALSLLGVLMQLQHFARVDNASAWYDTIDVYVGCAVALIVLTGRRVPVRFGVMPRRCSCGAEFEWAPFGGAGRVAAFLAALALLMSPLLILVWIARSLLQDSIVLHVVALAAALYWLRVCETLLVRFGLLRMEGVDAS